MTETSSSNFDKETLSDYRTRMGIATGALYDIKNNLYSIPQIKNRANDAIKLMDKVLSDRVASRRDSAPQNTAPQKDPREDAMGVPAYLLGDKIGKPSASNK